MSMFGKGNSPIDSDYGLLVGAMDFVTYLIMMTASLPVAVDSAVNDAKLQQMFHRFVTGSDKSEVDGGFNGAFVIFLFSAAMLYISNLLADGAVKRSSEKIKPAMIAKGFLLIFLTMFLIFGSFWIAPFLFVEFFKIFVICDLWETCKYEESIRTFKEYDQKVQIFTVVNELARIQYEDETAIAKLTKIQNVE